MKPVSGSRGQIPDLMERLRESLALPSDTQRRSLKPGVPTTDHWRVGQEHFVRGDGSKRGVCVSVTPWGSNQVRWVRLRFEDGTEKSYAPSHLLLR